MMKLDDPLNGDLDASMAMKSRNVEASLFLSITILNETIDEYYEWKQRRFKFDNTFLRQSDVSRDTEMQKKISYNTVLNCGK